MELFNKEIHEKILKNEETINLVVAQNAKDAAVSEERMNIFNKSVEEVKNIVDSLGSVGETIDVYDLANNPEKLKEKINDVAKIVLELQEAYLNASDEYTNKVNM